MSEGAKWRGVDKPGGAEFHSLTVYKYERDCPICKFGTLKQTDARDRRVFFRCIDCRSTITQTENKNQ